MLTINFEGKLIILKINVYIFSTGFHYLSNPLYTHPPAGSQGMANL